MANEVKITLSAEDQTKAAFAQMQTASAGLVSQLKAHWIALSAATAGTVLAIRQTINFAKEIATLANDIDRNSKMLNMSTDAYQRWVYVAKMSDISQEEFSMGMKFLSRNMDDASRGAGTAVKWFQAMGISVKDAAGNLRPFDAVMLDIAAKFSAWEDGPRKIAAALDIFGRSGERLIPMMNSGRDSINEMGRAAKIASKDAIEAGVRAEKAFKDMADNAKIFKLELAPIALLIANILDGFVNVARYIKEFPWTKGFAFGPGIGPVDFIPSHEVGEAGKSKKAQPPLPPRTDIEIKAESELIRLLLKQVEVEKQIADFNFDYTRKNELHELELQILDRQLDNKVKQILEDKQLTDSEKNRQIAYEKGLAVSEKDLVIQERKKEKWQEITGMTKTTFEAAIQTADVYDAEVQAKKSENEYYAGINAKAQKLLDIEKQIQENALNFQVERAKGDYEEYLYPGLSDRRDYDVNKSNWDTIKKQMEDLQKFWEGITMDMGGSLMTNVFDVAEDGFKNLDEHLKSMFNDLLKMIEKLLINMALTGTFSGMKGVGGWGGLLGLVFPSAGDVGPKGGGAPAPGDLRGGGLFPSMAGTGIGGTTIINNINNNIYANDMQTFADAIRKNKAVVMQVIDQNASLRGSMRNTIRSAY